MKPEGFSTRRMRSYAESPVTAAQLSEKNALGANRREEYRKVAEIFLRCKDMDGAHRMSAMVFGLERPFHLSSEADRETDSMNQSVYDEPAAELTLRPRVRTYREKSGRTSIRDTAQEKAQARRQAVEQMKQDWKRIGELERGGRIDFSDLPVIEPRVREILLKWLSDALEDGGLCGKDRGRKKLRAGYDAGG